MARGGNKRGQEMQIVPRDSQCVKSGYKEVVAEKGEGSKGKSVSVCGLCICLVFKMRAPWGCLNADGKGLGERQRVKTGGRKDKRSGIQQILAELTNSCYISLLKMLRWKLINCTFPAKISKV